MTNTEAIAAIIAANTPLKAEQYAAPYTLARSSSGHEAIWTDGQELSNAVVLSHLNGQEAALVEAMKDLGEARGSLAKTQTWLTEESATVQRLRAQLDEARGHIAALLIVTRAASVMASAITAYFNKRGVAHSLKDGNEDIMGHSRARRPRVPAWGVAFTTKDEDRHG
jgi:hypothetical protein